MGQLLDNKVLLDDLRDHLRALFHDDIDTITLFGSRVTDQYCEHSDYDILVVLRDDYTWKKERAILDACYDMDLKYDILTDVKVISQKELDSIRGRQPYIQNAINHGITVPV